MKTKIKHIRRDLRERIGDGTDLVVDFATLGEYGYQVREPECRPEPCVPGRAHAAVPTGSTALERRAQRLARFAA